MKVDQLRKSCLMRITYRYTHQAAFFVFEGGGIAFRNKDG